MQKPTKALSVNRILDANLNRAKEGVRVCEEILRFIVEDPVLTENCKALRNALRRAASKLENEKFQLLKERSSLTDIGIKIFGAELKRNNVEDIFLANIQRVKESLRVLEEFSKLKNTLAARAFKKIRYDAYELEKKAACKIAALRDHR